jgi:hypothetical protein
MGDEFLRPQEGFRFEFGGMKTNARPDSLPPGKYPIAINVRGYSGGTIQSRPGAVASFTAATTGLLYPISDMRTYAALASSNAPRTLAYDLAGRVWLDTGVNIGTLAVGVGSNGASLIPFRPGASPQPWMYIANGGDYQKFSAPTVNDVITQRKVGIAEPQFAPYPAIQENFINITGSPGYVNGGTASAISSSNRVSDTAGVVLQDPTGAPVWTVQVGAASAYQKLQTVILNGTNQMMVMDVFAALPNALTIQSIFYFSGTTGLCVIVPAGLASEGGGSIFKDTLLTTFRRGTMIVVGTEKCYVWSVSEGPNGGISIETSTTGAHTTTDSLTTVPAISVISATPTVQSSTGTATLSVDAGGPGPAWTTGPPSTVSITPAQFVSDNLNITGFGMSIPSTAIVQGIAFTVNWQTSSDTDVGDNQVQALKGVSAVGPDHSALPSGVHPYTYGSSLDLWGTTWAPADINAANFGITLGAINYGINHRAFLINSATVTVFYSTPSGGTPTPPVAGQTITDPDSTYQVTTGIGTVTSSTVPANPFNLSGASFQTEDYISIGIKIDTLVNLTEMKFLLDVGDGSFTQNFYYYTIRPSDIAAAIANTVTQIAASQTTAQRSAIDAETAAISAQAGSIDTTSGAQLLPGSGQWTQVVFPITALTRVGNDQTKSLQTLTKIQFLWNASGTINVATDLPFVFGGYQPDVGDIGAPFQYRVRPRAQSTGVVGNPSPASRYGVNPRRGQVTVYLPSATYDPQIDTWDIFRYGGAVTSYRFIGSVPSASATFIDNYDDAAAEAGEALDFDNFEPWPSVDLPNTGVASLVNGTVAIVSTTDTDILSYLPGTLVQLGGLNVYTLWARPTFISGTNYLLQFVENAGAGTNVSYLIQEPFLANQHLPYMWGPDATGTVFACGDAFRPGTVSFSKNYAPDSAPDSYNLEISPPSEPLVGGETLDGLAFVASPERWWALYPQPGNTAQRYAIVQQPFPRGIAAPFAHCNDGISLYWVAKDGIYSSTKGSLTDADLYNLFPHEGVQGEDYIYNGVTIPAPDYRRVLSFRLFFSLGYLYFIYQNTNGVYQSLTLDVNRMAWTLDVYPSGITAGCHVEQIPQTPQTGSRAETLFASFLPTVGPNFKTFGCIQTLNQNDFFGTAIPCTLATNEWDGGDVRAPKQWGDFFVDLVPAATAGVAFTPMSLGAAVFGATTFISNTVRTRYPVATVPISGTIVSDFMGLYTAWADDFSVQSVSTKLFLWQPSYAIQPARTLGWRTFGASFGMSGYGHIREIVLAYVAASAVTLTITSYDGQSPAPIILPSTGGAYQKTLFVVSANKGQLFNFLANSQNPFQFFLDDSEVRVGAWGRTSPYIVSRNFGGTSNRESAI